MIRTSYRGDTDRISPIDTAVLREPLRFADAVNGSLLKIEVGDAHGDSAE
jgi:hypothetical protein